ncbi:cysteine desulfurase family protein [Geitlerinema sp. PCC 9228]|jgi:cysteine desulfurase|uniref:cysteine desulfurase family protein n=1 Tax=Geitlerinema sp. PCC 9228 TaxID=111611 RepID=UPI0008F9A5EE|nr:cysteine desulfurase family protein [Geitlerinema sp. PCC 9228]
MQVYLDYSATTPPREEAIAIVQEVMVQQWGNPSSSHAWGQRAATTLERARMQVASLLNAEIESILFTSGGTEANNLALMGVARQYRQPQHIIVSSVEHPAVSQVARMLETMGWQVTYLPVDAEGRVSPQDLEAALQDNTVLVSIIYGQSEVGTVQPIAQLVDIAHARGVCFHTDAVQAVGRLPIDLQKLPVDLLSLSSHKIYGPQGAGALYIRPQTAISPWMLGGGQEEGMRSGTQALPAIAGFGVAAEQMAAEMATEIPRLQKLRDRLIAQLSEIPGFDLTGSSQSDRLPHHVSFCLTQRDENITGKTLVRQMNRAGIAISSGSACHSGSVAPSPILLAMGYSEFDARSAVRMTLGRHTATADIDWTAMAFRQVIERLQPEPALSVR